MTGPFQRYLRVFWTSATSRMLRRLLPRRLLMTGTLDAVDRLVTVSELQHELQPVYEAYSAGALAAGSLTIRFRGREVEFR